MQLTIAENFRGLFYVPYYVLRERSLAEQHGLEVKWLPPGSPGGAIDDVKSGKIDLTWGGPMRVMIDHDSTEDNEHRLLSLSQSVGRDPFCLLANRPNLSLADLPNLLRQQLILAQVRIMELEDRADELAPRLRGQRRSPAGR